MNGMLRKIAPRQLLAAAVLLVCASGQSHGGLLLQYKFNEGSGTTAADSGTGSPANAIVTGSWVSSSPGIAYASSVSTVGMVNSGSSNAAISTSSNLSKISSMRDVTFTGWVNLAAKPSNFFGLFSTGTTGIPSNVWFSGSGNGLGLNFTGGDSASNNTNDAFPLNTWVFFAVTYDGDVSTNNVNYYTGTQTGTVSRLGTTVSYAAGTTQSNVTVLEIAGRPGTTLARTPSGYFSDFRIYNEVLSSSALEAVRVEALVPEPSSFALLAAGFGALVLFRRRR